LSHKALQEGFRLRPDPAVRPRPASAADGHAAVQKMLAAGIGFRLDSTHVAAQQNDPEGRVAKKGGGRGGTRHGCRKG
jgi:hypothetical protein